MLFIFISCTNRDNEHTPGNATHRRGNMNENNPEASINRSEIIYDFNRNYAFDQKDELKDDLNTAIDRLNKRMDKVKDMVDSSSKQTQNWYNDKKDQFDAQKDSLKDKIGKIDDAKRADWNNFQSKLKDDWNNLQKSFNNMREHIASNINSKY